MKKSRCTEAQIVKILKEVEAGRHVKEVCRRYGIQKPPTTTGISKYGGMEASNTKPRKDLEEENRRIQQMCSELNLDHKILKYIFEKSCSACIVSGIGRLRTGAT